MSNQTPLKAIVLSQGSTNNSVTPLRISLINEDGTPKTILAPAAAQANSVATTVEGVVTDFNALLTKLRAAGHLAP